MASARHRPAAMPLRLAAFVILSSSVAGVVAPGNAKADCASGDGNVTTPGLCTVPQNLTGSTGAIVGGATLSTGGANAYTISSNNANVANSGSVITQGASAFLINGGGGGPLVNMVNLTNSGSIVGGIVIPQSANLAATINQAGGTIQGDIQLNGLLTVVNITGGTINGNIVDATPASGNAGSGGRRAGTINFDLGAGSFTTNGIINVRNVNVRSGTLTLQNDIGQLVTNSGTMRVVGARRIGGGFTQTAAGTLAMQITPQSSSQLIVLQEPNGFGGAANLAGTLALSYAPGTYRARSYTLISATHNLVNGAPGPALSPGQTVLGAFSNVTGFVPTPGLTQTIAYGLQEVDLVLSGRVAPLNVTIFPAVTSVLLLNGQQVNGILLDRLGSRYGGVADGPFALAAAAAPPVRTAQAGNLGTVLGIGSALPDALAAQGAWIRGIGGFTSVDRSGSTPGFSGRSGGFLAGIDRPVLPSVSLGLAAGGRVAAYGGGWWGPQLLTGTIGYAYDRITTARNAIGAGIASAAHDGHELSVAGQWSLPMAMPGVAGPATVTPKLGIQYLRL